MLSDEALARRLDVPTRWAAARADTKPMRFALVAHARDGVVNGSLRADHEDFKAGDFVEDTARRPSRTHDTQL